MGFCGRGVDFMRSIASLYNSLQSCILGPQRFHAGSVAHCCASPLDSTKRSLRLLKLCHDHNSGLKLELRHVSFSDTAE